MKIFALCKPYLLKFRASLITYYIITIFVGLFALANPFLIGDFIDSLITDGTMTAVYRFAIIFAALNIARTALSYITMIIYTKTQSKAAHEFTQDAISHVQGLSLSFVNKRDTDYLSQVINGDTNMLIIFCISVVQNFILNGVYLIMPLIVLFSLNAPVTSVLMAFLLIYILIYGLFRKPLFNRSMSLRVAQNSFFAKLLEQLKFTKFIKVHVLGGFFRKRMDKSFDNLIDETLKSQKLNFAYTSLDTAVTTIVQIVLFLLGGYLILNGNFTIGMFTIFSMYFNMMLGAAKYFFSFGKNYQDNLVSYSRLTEILESPLETQGSKKLNSIEKVSVKNLNFSFNGAETDNIINDLNLELVKGNIYGIVGKNGAGKSTLINLLMGMYIDEKQGEISFNGISSKVLDMQALRKEHIGISEQESVILGEDVDYNINLTIPKERKTKGELDKYLKILNLYELVNNINEKEDNSPQNFSGGEKQKLSILRLLLKNPSLMIFDEPTSAMDIESSKKFMMLLQSLKSDRIIVIISHDEHIVRECDGLIYL